LTGLAQGVRLSADCADHNKNKACTTLGMTMVVEAGLPPRPLVFSLIFRPDRVQFFRASWYSGREDWMPKKQYTNEQIAFALRQAELGTPVAEICRKMGVAEPAFYRWK
jgi:hypothetical protein